MACIPNMWLAPLVRLATASFARTHSILFVCLVGGQTAAIDLTSLIQTFVQPCSCTPAYSLRRSSLKAGMKVRWGMTGRLCSVREKSLVN